MSKTLLDKTLTTIEHERVNPPFDCAFELVRELLAAYGEKNLASRLYGDISPTVSWEVVADLFGILTWITSDNGDKLTRETEQWLLEGNDIRKIQIALNLDSYPFRKRTDMERVLSALAISYPQLADKCRALIDGRRKLTE